MVAKPALPAGYWVILDSDNMELPDQPEYLRYLGIIMVTRYIMYLVINMVNEENFHVRVPTWYQRLHLLRCRVTQQEETSELQDARPLH